MKRALLFMLSCCLICSFGGCGDGKADSGTVSGYGFENLSLIIPINHVKEQIDAAIQ